MIRVKQLGSHLQQEYLLLSQAVLEVFSSYQEMMFPVDGEMMFREKLKQVKNGRWYLPLAVAPN